jgi:hypothetical protein
MFVSGVLGEVLALADNVAKETSDFFPNGLGCEGTAVAL